MIDGVSIRIWTRETVPDRFRRLGRMVDDSAFEDVVFVAHVPAAMVDDRTYRAANGQSGTEGWMRDGELGLFGINALDMFPHPDGDGLLIFGSGV